MSDNSGSSGSSNPAPTLPSIPSSSTPRQDLVQNAVTFLLDPSVQSAPLAKRIAFLESKGLSSSEIETALHQVSSRGSTAPTHAQAGTGRVTYNPGGSGYGQGTAAGTHLQQMVAPQAPARDWRDYFIMAIVSGGVTFALVSLFRRYVLPHLLPPSGPAFQQTSDALTSAFDSLAEQVRKLEEAQEKEKTDRENEREEVEKVLGEVREGVKDVREGEERAREEWEEVRREMEGIKELVPKMLERLTSNQTRTLTELQQELKSLKLLLLNRTPGAHLPSAPSPSSSPAPSNATGHARSSTLVTGSSNTSSLGTSTPATPVPLQQASPFLSGFGLGGTGRPSIPSWQLRPTAGQEAEVSGSSGSGSTKGKEVLVSEEASVPEIGEREQEAAV
ncbi:hypothetical protein DACRYDRAFT_102189 [Dacryopinax primogenitus]|uniref:Peroxisomal membrane protein PEX14 n=1 Tax=Dacryopinax primogenitus (strain DJM 731) TaxID=1858805 RepID=M5FS18_DACPD|nr:uncharacterized protein DACRYDRAFT_102189 [Dacryopinax primogenitus]EJT97909.1 hypothetical protein DACRYDRAFT_102189 [Dacryopinax primogenitus]